MAEIKKVLLSVYSSIQALGDNGLPEGEPEKDEINAVGELKRAGGITKISYEEKRDGAKTLCEIIIRDETVKVKREGCAECEMVFSKQKSYEGIYKVPPFSFDLKIETTSLDISFTETEGEISLKYIMSIGGALRLAQMKIHIKNN